MKYINYRLFILFFYFAKNQTPVVDAGNGGVLTCTIKNITLFGTVTNGSSTDLTYSWTTPNGNIVGASNTLTAVVDSEGKYFLKVENKINGCSAIDSTTVTQDVIQPTANAGANLELSCTSPTIDIQGVGTGKQALAYLWTTSNGTIVKDADKAKVTVQSAGFYKLLVTNTENGCFASDTVNVLSLKPTILASVVTEPLCNNGKGSLKITSISGGTPPYSYSIDNGKSFYPYNEFTGLNPNEYFVKIKDTKNCQDQSSIIINNPPKLALNINPTVKVKIGEDIQLIATAYPTTPLLKSIKWSPDSMLSCKDCLNPSVKAPLKNIYFTIKVISENGCIAETFTNLEVDKEIGVYVPTAFSPNGDGNNDRFMIFGKPELVLRIKWMRIFDRWGDVVYSDTAFKVNDTNRGWDGTFNGNEVNPSVFIWNCEVEFIDGTSKVMKGDVTLQK